MNNNPNCKKKCLDCYHCEPRCIQSCRDCHRCRTFMMNPSEFNHPVPRDMFMLTRNNEFEQSNEDSKISDVQPDDTYVPKPMYCATKKCLVRDLMKNAKTIMDSNVSLCYFCTPKDMNSDREIFKNAKGRGTVPYSVYGNGEIVEYSVL